MSERLSLTSFFLKHPRKSSRDRQTKIEDSVSSHGPAASVGEHLKSHQGASKKWEHRRPDGGVSKLPQDAPGTPYPTVVISLATTWEARPTHDSNQTPADLWDQAYNNLQANNPKLFDSYKRCVLGVDRTPASATTSLIDLDALDSRSR